MWNGQGHANGEVPSSGRVPLSTLDETVANFQVSQNRTFSLTEYFEPYHLCQYGCCGSRSWLFRSCAPGSYGFSGNGVSKIAIAVGKNDEAYILDVN